MLGIDASATLDRTIEQVTRPLYCHLGGQPALAAYAGYPGQGSPERELSH